MFSEHANVYEIAKILLQRSTAIMIDINLSMISKLKPFLATKTHGCMHEHTIQGQA